MKKTVVLLSMALTLSLLPGCGSTANEPEIQTQTVTETSQPAVAAPTEEPTSAPTNSEIVVIDAGTLSEHENTWFHKEESDEDGLFFKLADNDLPVDETWATRYVPAGTDGVQLIRYGEYHKVNGRVLKYSENEYYLALDAWLLGEFAPLQVGDVVMIQGVFMHPDGKYEPAIRFDTTYITVESEDSVTFSTTPPEA